MVQQTAHDERPAPARRRAGRRRAVLLGSGAAAVLLGLAALALPAPYVVESPGPTFNTIGELQKRPLIEIPGRTTYPATGDLDLTTVYVSGGPNAPVTFLEVLAGWLDPARSVSPVELVYPPGTTGEQINEQNTAAMTSSQESSVAAAFSYLGVDYGQKLSVAGFADDSASKGVLKVGDAIETVNGKTVKDIDVLRGELNASGGQAVDLGVRRNGERITEKIAPKANPQGVYQLGVALRIAYSFPYQVKIQLDNVGGPSAGMMFALGIVDKLTPGPMTGGKHFAGTGTIDADGEVGPIGGIAQKMLGAAERGATVFLAPADNCGEVSGHVPDHMQVVKVSTLTEAVDAVTLIGQGKDSSALPSCG
ncbi:signal protein PDZ [Arthrobacter sp. I2-34]|uniref:endopeptidase La n=1 Tax=Arthrobacter hankyongi TaxID=2904801 RepID=A0ABS9L7W2_9MICC|nr:S16 family serine protease [Arthrobacter hankyongi]MCG2622770.1 signal protein PDZ [Arthrobacter hankyongi]